MLLASSAGELDRSQMGSVSVSMDQPKVAQSILLERFSVQDGEPVTGCLLDDENGHFGLVGTTDVPLQGFVESVRKSNLSTVDQLGKEAGKVRAEADKAGLEIEGGRKGNAGKGAEQGTDMRVGTLATAIKI